MAAYSMGLRDRVLADRDAGMSTEEVAERYHVSVSWVNRLRQRRQEIGGEIGHGRRRNSGRVCWPTTSSGCARWWTRRRTKRCWSSAPR